MVSRGQKFRLGLFITIALVALIVFLVFVAGKKFIEKRDYYFIKYNNVSVSGLQVGSQVKYYGINVGSVENIRIDREDISNVIVKIGIKEGTPVKADMRATLISVGITGLKQIELTGGTDQAELLEPGSYIEAGKSYIEEITGRAEVITEKVEKVLNNLIYLTDRSNSERVTQILERMDTLLVSNSPRLAAVLENANALIEDNQETVADILGNMERASRNFERTTQLAHETTAQLKTTVAQLSVLLDTLRLDRMVTNITAFSDTLTSIRVKALIEKDLTQTVADLNRTVNEAQAMINHIDATVIKGRRDFLETLEILRETVYYLNEFSRRISEDPSYLIRPKTRD